MASDREGTPVAALESMVHGVPMVAPAVGGIPDVLGDGGGVLVPRHDVPALARELLALVRDPERRAAIGARGRDRSADYTAERQLERCMALYDELLQAPAARRRAARRGAPVRRGAA
jgi:glycosyltransferase involved in cell wall biosynthesis